MADAISKTRIARDPKTGKNYKVDGDMTFEEWKAGLSDEQRAAMKANVKAARTKPAKTVDNPVKKQSIFVPAKTVNEAEKYAEKLGVKYPEYNKLPLDTANELNRALETLPKDIRPVFVGDSKTLEEYYGSKLPRTSNHYYGVHIESLDGMRLGRDPITGMMKYDAEA